MAKKEKKSQAELYREERKERIAKANKKNAKKSSSAQAGKLVKRLVAVVLAVAVVAGIGYYVVETTGIKSKYVTALTVGDEKVSEAEFEYYYYLAYQQALSIQQQYESYGISYIDSSVSPDEQAYPNAEEGDTRTWADKLVEDAKTAAQSTLAYYQEAKKANYKLDEDQQKTIDETIDSIAESAKSNGVSVNSYLKSMFGMNESSLRKQLEKEQLASKFQEDKQEEFKNGITDEDLQKELKANPNTYGLADVRYYSITPDTLTQEENETDDAFAARQKKAMAEVVKEAKAMNKTVKDEASFKAAVAAYEAKQTAEAAKDEAAEDAVAAETADTATEAAADTAADTAAEEKEEEEDTTLYAHVAYSTLSSSIEEKGAEWAFSADRKAGDHTVIEGENGAYVVYVIAPKYLTAHSVTVRYCLVNYNEDMTSAADSDEREEAQDKAEKLYKEWKEGDATEDTFATLCTNNSGDTSTSEDGGKIDVRYNQMVSAFEDWCFDSARKAGDCEVIEAEEYGFFLVYFVSDNADDLDWENTAKSTLSSNLYSDFSEKLLGDEGGYKPADTARVTNGVSKDFCKRMKRNLALNAQYGS